MYMLITYKNLYLFKKSPAELLTPVICNRLICVLEIHVRETGHLVQDLHPFF